MQKLRDRRAKNQSQTGSQSTESSHSDNHDTNSAGNVNGVNGHNYNQNGNASNTNSSSPDGERLDSVQEHNGHNNLVQRPEQKEENGEEQTHELVQLPADSPPPEIQENNDVGHVAPENVNERTSVMDQLVSMGFAAQKIQDLLANWSGESDIGVEQAMECLLAMGTPEIAQGTNRDQNTGNRDDDEKTVSERCSSQHHDAETTNNSMMDVEEEVNNTENQPLRRKRKKGGSAEPLAKEAVGDSN